MRERIIVEAKAVTMRALTLRLRADRQQNKNIASARKYSYVFRLRIDTIFLNNE